MDENDIVDQNPTADRMAAEIRRSGSATQECLTYAHAAAVAQELKNQGFTAEALGRLVTAY